MTKRKLAHGLLQQFRAEQQLAKAQKECAKLIGSIADYFKILVQIEAQTIHHPASVMGSIELQEKGQQKGQQRQCIQQVREEMADVEIIMEQLRIIVGPDEYDEVLKNKIAKVAKDHGIK